MKKKFTDIHHHILYGIDDGPSTPEKMYAMIDRAAAQGIHRIVATPHVTPGVKRFDEKQYHIALDAARNYVREKEYDLRFYEGAEILYTEQTCAFLQEGRTPTMAGTDFVLVEFSPDIEYKKLERALKKLLRAGYRPIVAHVERYRCLAVRPSRAIALKDELDVAFQMNCSSVLDKRGFFERRFVERMLDEEMIDFIATDAHNATSRPVRMKAAWRKLKELYGASYARGLTDGGMLFEDVAE